MCHPPAVVLMSARCLRSAFRLQSLVWRAAEWRHLANAVKNVLAAYAATVLL